jgi:trk system potassium uptake protein
MKVLIAGAGSVGRYMAGQLAASGHQVTVIDKDPSVMSRHAALAEGVQLAIGDACELTTLSSVATTEVDVVAAVTGDDEDNLVISLLAKQELGVPRVVARVNNPDNEWLFDESWGVDVSVSTPHLLTGLVEEAVNTGAFVRLLSLDHGRARLAEVTLAAGSPAVGVEIGALGLPRSSTVVAVLRAAQVVLPHAETTLLAGDEVIVLVTGDAEPAVHRALVG